MTRELLFRISALMATISLLLLPFATQSLRLRAFEPAMIARIIHSPAPSKNIDVPAISVSRDPFVPLVYAGASRQNDATIVVRAIALGAEPAALIEENGKTRLLAVGDPVAGSRVRAITAREIQLVDGRHFTIQVQQQ